MNRLVRGSAKNTAFHRCFCYLDLCWLVLNSMHALLTLVLWVIDIFLCRFCEGWHLSSALCNQIWEIVEFQLSSIRFCFGVPVHFPVGIFKYGDVDWALMAYLEISRFSRKLG
ncbi:hypothetical protein RchiOBHm_Chr7g0178411 [Rosa chinensis]|uniref:Uncharacterized protein n=1 Tax=Rosa chinensis TaxID=74649 RepID=A0A2P6P1V3_ROSCH|nr:hypothetical protein RchiOBHm_Chr7g0178411 [Rosa chinensis]